MMSFIRLDIGQFKPLASSTHLLTKELLTKGCLSLLVIFLYSCQTPEQPGSSNTSQPPRIEPDKQENGVDIEDSRDTGAQTLEPKETEEVPLSIKVLPSQRLRVGETMQVKVSSAQAGYLYVWDIGNRGEITRLFPNQFVETNNIKAGTVTIPENSWAGFGLTVGEPLGNSMVVALLVEEEKVQKLQPENLESLVATNARAAWQQLRQRLNQMLGQGGWITATLDYEIIR
jgi:hypothetical protein